jgi:hypothetical protein
MGVTSMKRGTSAMTRSTSGEPKATFPASSRNLHSQIAIVSAALTLRRTPVEIAACPLYCRAILFDALTETDLPTALAAPTDT